MNWRAWMLFAVLGVLWGLPYFFIKLAVREMAPFDVAWSRIALGAIVLLPVAWHRGAFRSLAGDLLPIAAFAVCEFVVPFSAIAAGERWISSSLAGVLIATVPMTIAVLSRWFGLHEPLEWVRVVGMLVGFSGVIALLGLGAVDGPLGWAGVGLTFLATLGYALGPLIVQRFLRQRDMLGVLTLSLFIASLLLAVPAWLGRPARTPGAVALGSLAVLGIVCTAIAMLLYFQLVALAGPARAAIITYVNPAIAALLGVSLLHEHFGAGGALGLLLILAGSWLATRGPRQSREDPASC